jgi:ribosomal protein S18 acetylase RimI-like enzyme
MKLLMRKFQQEDDYQRIRQFLQEVFMLNQRREICWPVYRWDYWRWHVNENIWKINLEAAVFLWESPDSRLAAVLHPEEAGDAFLQVHPEFHCLDLDVEMVSLAETQFARQQQDGRQRLVIWVHESDAMRQDLLLRRGYKKSAYPEYQRRRYMDAPIPNDQPPEGYLIRGLGDESELPARSWLCWRAFHPQEPDEKYEGWQWYRNVQRAPLYRQDLDLVAVAPSGELAAFCTLWFDEVTRTAGIEPVGTHPAHQRRGLGRAILVEGLRRVGKLGATLCTVSSLSDAAGCLFASLGFTECERSELWIKLW